MSGPSLAGHDVARPTLPAAREHSAAQVRAALPGARRVIVLDDDPTGTQTVRDLPVLTRWSVDDLRWALKLGAPAIFVLTNSRSLSAEHAAARNREVAQRCIEAAAAEGIDIAFASRSDSTLRGHFPLEPAVLAEVSAAAGQRVDAVLVVPAYVDAGRITVDAWHWLDTVDGLVPVGASEYAGDATFGYRNSHLPAWIDEKSGGRISADEVATISLREIRSGGPAAVACRLTGLTNMTYAVIDAVTDDDLRIVASAVLGAEAQGRRFIYRVGPSFVRARCGQERMPPVRVDELRDMLGVRPCAGGLIVVGSHVALTTRQLGRLRQRRRVADVAVDVDAVADPQRVEQFVATAIALVTAALAHGDVVLASTRAVKAGSSAAESLELSARVSCAIARIVAGVVAQCVPAYVLAKGGITSADVATAGLGIERSWVRGTLLDGVVSLWQPVDGSLPGTPYIVFAGNVGDDEALADVVDRLAIPA